MASGFMTFDVRCLNVSIEPVNIFDLPAGNFYVGLLQQALNSTSNGPFA